MCGLVSANASSNGYTFAYCIGGGTDKNNAFFDNVYYATALGNGSLSSWKETQPFPFSAEE